MTWKLYLSLIYGRMREPCMEMTSEHTFEYPSKTHDLVDSSDPSTALDHENHVFPRPTEGWVFRSFSWCGILIALQIHRIIPTATTGSAVCARTRYE